MLDRYKWAILPLLLVIVLFSVSAGKRYDQLNEWKKNPERFFYNDGVTAMTTLDAYNWIRYAKEYDKGNIGSDKIDPVKNAGSGSRYPENVRMLSFLLSKVSSFFQISYYYAGLYLIPILASLFTIPLFLYMYRIGHVGGGVLGALIGTFSLAFYARSSLGRVDTDAMNLFFPLLTSFFIYCAGVTQKESLRYVYASFAGLSMGLFIWWYGNTGFIFPFFTAMLIYLVLQKVPLKTMAGAMVCFIIFCNPVYFIESLNALYQFFFSSYFSGSGSTHTNIIFPNIVKTITETRKTGILGSLAMVLNQPYVAGLGLAGFVVLGAFKFKQLIPILPMLALGLLSFKSSNRFAMYLAPFVGMGLGFILDYLVVLAGKYVKNYRDLYQKVTAVAVSFVLFFTFSDLTAYSMVPRESIKAPIIQSFIEMKRVVPQNSAMFTWWDYGYALQDIGGFSTYHDGGGHGGPKTYLVAKALTSHDPKVMHQTMSYIDQHGVESIHKLVKKGVDYTEFLNTITKGEDRLARNDAYVLFTNDMIGKYGAISFFGDWSFEKNQSEKNFYIQVRCSTVKNNVFICQNARIDMNTGMFNQTRLNQIIFIKDGKVIAKKMYDMKSNHRVQVLMKGDQVFQIFLLNDKVYYSNFNQMFLLGNYDKDRFKEVYYKPPYSRVYQVLNN